MNANIMPGLPTYGAAELLEFHQRFFLRALLAASLIEFTLLGAFRMWQHATAAPLPPGRPPVVVCDWKDLPPAPPVNQEWRTSKDWIVPKTAVKPTNGVPVPVPELEADPAMTIPTQSDLGRETGLVNGTGDGGDIVYRIAPDLQIETPPEIFTPVEKDPVCIHRVTPAYPETARLARLEGTVFVKLWIDRHGKVRQVVLLKSDNPIFDQAVMDAAKQWVFTPAIMNAGPVAVWLAVPFRFALQ